MKRIAAIMMVLIMALGLAACKSSGGGNGGGGTDNGGKDPIIGVWKSAGVEYGGKTMSMEEFAKDVVMEEGFVMVFTINEDGTFTDVESADGYGSYTYSGTWAKNGDKYVFTVEGTGIEMEIRDGKLVNTSSDAWDGAIIYFEKQ